MLVEDNDDYYDALIVNLLSTDEEKNVSETTLTRSNTRFSLEGSIVADLWMRNNKVSLPKTSDNEGQKFYLKRKMDGVKSSTSIQKVLESFRGEEYERKFCRTDAPSPYLLKTVQHVAPIQFKPQDNSESLDNLAKKKAEHDAKHRKAMEDVRKRKIELTSMNEEKMLLQLNQTIEKQQIIQDKKELEKKCPQTLARELQKKKILSWLKIMSLLNGTNALCNLTKDSISKHQRTKSNAASRIQHCYIGYRKRQSAQGMSQLIYI